VPRAGVRLLPFEGVHFRYAEGTFDHLPDWRGLVPKASGSIPNVTLLGSFRSENFAVVYETYVNATAAAIYRFVANADDGVRIVVDDQVVVEDDGKHAARDAEGDMALGPGFHSMRIEYFQAGGEKSLSIKFSGPYGDE
jgi:hypothetical protein